MYFLKNRGPFRFACWWSINRATAYDKSWSINEVELLQSIDQQSDLTQS